MPFLSPTTLTQDEQRLILRVTAKHPRDHLIISAALGTGLRLCELVGLNVGDDVRLAVVDVDKNHPLVWTEQLMPVFPVVRVHSADEGIDLAVAAEGGRRHTAAMHSRNLDHLSRMARLINCSIFVKNGPCYAGLGEGGEGFCSFSIASPTGEGMTGPRSFTRQRRCVLVDHFRIV